MGRKIRQAIILEKRRAALKAAEKQIDNAAISRKGDSLSTGHICTGTTTLDISGQSTVRANGILIARVSDLYGITSFFHFTTLCAHVANVNAGSSVRVAGKFVARIGDSADAGKMTSGSSNVFSG